MSGSLAGALDRLDRREFGIELAFRVLRHAADLVDLSEVGSQLHGLGGRAILGPRESFLALAGQFEADAPHLDPALFDQAREHVVAMLPFRDDRFGRLAGDRDDRLDQHVSFRDVSRHVVVSVLGDDGRPREILLFGRHEIEVLRREIAGEHLEHPIAVSIALETPGNALALAGTIADATHADHGKGRTLGGRIVHGTPLE